MTSKKIAEINTIKTYTKKSKMIRKSFAALFLASCSAVYIEDFDDQHVFAQIKEEESCVDCMGDVECEYDQVIANGWGNINGRLAHDEGDGWIKVIDTHLRPCHVRMNKASMSPTRVAEL